MIAFVNNTSFQILDDEVFSYDSNGYINSPSTRGKKFDRIIPGDLRNFNEININGVRTFYNKKQIVNYNTKEVFSTSENINIENQIFDSFEYISNESDYKFYFNDNDRIKIIDRYNKDSNAIIEMDIINDDDNINYISTRKRNNNFDKKFMSIILVIKNRKKQFEFFIKYLNKIKDFNKYMDLIIVEDNSPNNLNEQLEYIECDYQYNLVDTGDNWNRCKLINFGLSKNKLDLSLICDVDFIFNYDFIDRFRSIFIKFDFINRSIGIPVVETGETKNSHGDIIRMKNDFYGHYYVFNTKKLISLGGYNTNIKGHGLEERELWVRLSMLNDHEILFLNNKEIKDVFILHMSHNDDIRGKTTNAKKRIYNVFNNFGNIRFKHGSNIIKSV